MQEQQPGRHRLTSRFRCQLFPFDDRLTLDHGCAFFLRTSPVQIKTKEPTLPDLTEDAVKLLGQPASEIKSVEKTKAGLVMEMVDGSAYIDVPSGAPDGSGKSGLMYFRSPCDGYAGTFPVYTSPDGPPVALVPEDFDPAPGSELVADDADSPVPIKSRPAKGVKPKSTTRKPR